MLAEYFYDRALNGHRLGGIDLNLDMAFILAGKNKRLQDFLLYAVNRAKEHGVTFRQSQKALAKITRERKYDKYIRETAMAGYIAGTASTEFNPVSAIPVAANDDTPLKLSSQSWNKAMNIFNDFIRHSLDEQIEAPVYEMFISALHRASDDLGPLEVIRKLEPLLSEDAVHGKAGLSWILEDFIEQQIRRAWETGEPHHIAHILMDLGTSGAPSRMTNTLARLYYQTVSSEMDINAGENFASRAFDRMDALPENHPFRAYNRQAQLDLRTMQADYGLNTALRYAS